ncbi:MAG: hypothetical protein ACI8P9_005025 [Parasphingorhabdus sp.]
MLKLRIIPMIKLSQYWYVSLFFFAIVNHAQSQQPTEELPIGYATIDDAFDALSADENATKTEYEGWIIFNQKSAGKYILWSFTSEEHGAYPSVVRRDIISKDGKLYIGMNALCYADVFDCNELIDQFKTINENIRKKHEQGS